MRLIPRTLPGTSPAAAFSAVVGAFFLREIHHGQ